jgi:hypothetical protein
LPSTEAANKAAEVRNSRSSKRGMVQPTTY